ncbi:MAG TPA: hypothetical protein EYP10_12970 [Armatimonadetes bacterium]|nr:hypothetical protein [Armatimonadota bacterium]
MNSKCVPYIWARGGRLGELFYQLLTELPPMDRAAFLDGRPVRVHPPQALRKMFTMLGFCLKVKQLYAMIFKESKLIELRLQRLNYFEASDFLRNFDYRLAYITKPVLLNHMREKLSTKLTITRSGDAATIIALIKRSTGVKLTLDRRFVDKEIAFRCALKPAIDVLSLLAFALGGTVRQVSNSVHIGMPIPQACTIKEIVKTKTPIRVAFAVDGKFGAWLTPIHPMVIVDVNGGNKPVKFIIWLAHIIPPWERYKSTEPCGLRALHALLAESGVDWRSMPSQVWRPLRRHEASMLDIAKVARSLGLHVQGFEMHFEELMRCPPPFIIHVVPNHFVTVVHTTPTEVTLRDGDLYITIPQNLLRLWFNGYVLTAQCNSPRS